MTNESFDLSRRSFLLLGAGGTAAVSIAAIPGAPKTVDWLAENDPHRDLPETFVESVCGDCPAACPILLREVGGNVVGIRPLEPKPCMRAYTIPRQIVHSDRIRLPMVRDGERGSDRWISIEIGEAAHRLADLVAAHRHRTAILVRNDAEAVSMALAYIGNRCGAPLVARGEWIFSQAPVDALRESTDWEEWVPDIAGASGVMTFGYDFLQRTVPPVRMQEAFRIWRSGGGRREIVSIGPRLDLTASKSDEWLACRVGAEPLVAWAMAAVLVKNHWVADSARALPRFAEWADKIAAFDIERAADQANVKPSDIRRLARHLWDRRWLCLGPRRRLADQRPIVALNALIGLIKSPGGWMPVPRIGPAEFRAKSRAADIPTALRPGQIDLVIIYGENPAFTDPEPGRWIAALAHAKQIVVFSEIYTETAQRADLVIPIPHAAERAMHIFDRGISGIRRRITRPALPLSPDVGDPLAQVLLALGNKMGEVLQEPIPKTAAEFAGQISVEPPKLSALRLPDPDWSPPAYSFGLFHLLFETPLSLFRMTGAHLPYLITAVSPHLRRWWETTVELNPETAHTLGIADGSIVKVSSEIASIQASVKLYPGVPPDAVCMPLGLGHTLGVNAGKVGGNPAELVKFRAEDGVPIWEQTKVTIEKL